MPHVPRKIDRRIIDNDNDQLGIMNSNNNDNNSNNDNKNNDNKNNNNNNNNNNDNNISTAAAAAGTDKYKLMYQNDNDKQSIMSSNNNMRGGAGKKKRNDNDGDDDDDDSDFNHDDFLGSVGLEKNDDDDDDDDSDFKDGDFLSSLGLACDSSLYADEEGDIVNDSYYCDAGGKGRGRPRNKGCPHKEPDTTGMSDSQRAEAMEAYTTLRKAWNDKELNARRASTTIDVENCTGVTVKSLRRMVDVEERRMKVGDTFPDKETVSLRVVEEINISDSSDATFNRSDSQRVLASGTGFLINVLFNLKSGWRVDKYSIEKVEVASMKVAANVEGDDCQVGSADADNEEDYDDEDKECNEDEGDTESGELYYLNRLKI
jgi:hypothetical protein